jgi:toxin ParE1/3/4
LLQTAMNEKLFQVIWTHTAQQDLKRIMQFIAADSEARAKEIYSAIKEKAANLFLLPSRGRIVPELREIGVSMYRELVCPPWRIIYKIEESRVWVLAVFDGRRNIEDILFERLV